MKQKHTFKKKQKKKRNEATVNNRENKKKTTQQERKKEAYNNNITHEQNLSILHTLPNNTPKKNTTNHTSNQLI